MKTYGSRSFTVNVTNSLTALIASNKQRVSLVISSGATAGVNGIMDLFTSTDPNSAFMRVYAGTPLTLPYRDYGPIIKEQILARFSLSNADVIATEIFEIPAAQ